MIHLLGPTGSLIMNIREPTISKRLALDILLRNHLSDSLSLECPLTGWIETNMITVCSYCRVYLRGEADPNGLVSHGICPSCSVWVREQFLGLKIDQYLTRLEVPAVIVNSEGRVLVANEQAKHMLDKNENHYGFLGGEFMECQFARLPEGCGNTTHCSSCTIRGAVNMAMGGVEQDKVPAYLNKVDTTIYMNISAKKVEDNLVILTIDEVTRVESVPTQWGDVKKRPVLVDSGLNSETAKFYK